MENTLLSYIWKPLSELKTMYVFFKVPSSRSAATSRPTMSSTSRRDSIRSRQCSMASRRHCDWDSSR